MKKCFLIPLLLFSSNILAMGSEISELRNLMAEAYKSAPAAQNFYTHTRKISNGDKPALLGFKAIAELMMCKHLSNPLSKLAYFNKGKKHLEMALAKDNNNAELRFMRFCTQVNAPDMLGYNSAITGDKIFLIQYLKSQKSLVQKQDDALYNNVKKFLLNCKQCSEEEKKLIKNL